MISLNKALVILVIYTLISERGGTLLLEITEFDYFS